VAASTLEFSMIRMRNAAPRAAEERGLSVMPLANAAL
jgi:hypothetical protein